MDNYIIKEIAIERLKRIKSPFVMSEYGLGYERGLIDAIGLLNATPAADVQPVKRGFWLKTNDIFYKYCSVCGTKTDIAYSNMAKFCPECGAKMDLPEVIKG